MALNPGIRIANEESDWTRTIKQLLLLWAAMFCYLAFLLLFDGLSFPEWMSGLTSLLQTWTLEFWLPWVVLAPVVQLLAKRITYHPDRAQGFFLSHLSWFLVLIGTHALLLMLFQVPLTEFLRNGYPLISALIYTLIVAAFQINRLALSVQERRLDAARLNKNLSDSRLQTLKMQLNPHFLFNTLNSVSVLVEKNDNEQAQEMISQLCRFLRQTLSNSGEKWISLNKELEMAREYLAIEKIRFGQRLDYYVECEPIALAAKVPPMLLQPLFENAIVHGLAEKEGACRLSFECRVHDRRLFILISDNGEGFDRASNPAHKAGIGLSNVEARLKELYGDNYAFSIEKTIPSGTQVQLRIPAYKDSWF